MATKRTDPKDGKSQIHNEMKISRIDAKKVLEKAKIQENESKNTHVWLTSADGKTKTLKKRP